jgi:hypothetical protein
LRPAQTKNVLEIPHLDQWLGVMAHTCHREAQTGRLWSGPAQGIKWKSIPKITSAKRADRVAQVVECLPIKYNALNSTQYFPKWDYNASYRWNDAFALICTSGDSRTLSNSNSLMLYQCIIDQYVGHTGHYLAIIPNL